MGLAGLTPSIVLDLNAEDGTLELDALIANPLEPSRRGVKVRALIDTGSYMSFVPPEIVNWLDLQAQGQIHVRGIRFVEPSASDVTAERPVGRPIYPIAVTLSIGGRTLPPRRIFAVAAHQKKLIVGRNLLQWFTLHYHGAGALNPARADASHDPAAIQGFFELGAGLVSPPRASI